MPKIKTKCARLVATASARRGYVFSYQRPLDKGTLKREGRTLQFGKGGRTAKIGGRNIRTVVSILRGCGEIGRGVNKRCIHAAEGVVSARSYCGIVSCWYERPLGGGDLKRHGRKLFISDGGRPIVMNGYGINMLKRILRATGEVGGKVDRKVARVLHDVTA